MLCVGSNVLNQTLLLPIGCGPAGMFFLHALATKRKQLEEAGDVEALMKLPIVTVFEKSSSPGGVWRSDRSREGESDVHHDQQNTEASTNMYEGLWINGHKGAMEFFDYTFEDHFKTPQPVYLPRQQILEYMLARVTRHENIFQDVLFNTVVESVTYDDDLERFVIISRDWDGIISTQYFDKCIWASGTEGIQRMPEDVVEALSEYNGQVVHSSAMDTLIGPSSGGKNAVEGKRILLIGDSYSAEDLALQCIKLGAEKIYFTSRHLKGTASYVGSWPDDKVEMLGFAEVSGIKDDGTGKTIMFDTLNEEHPVYDLEDVSIVIFCTGYVASMDFVDDKLQPWKKDEDIDTWSMEDLGENTTEWRMKENAMTSVLGHIDPSKELDYDRKFMEEYRMLLISNPNMMYMYHTTLNPLLELDVMAWLCLAYITGETPVPSTEEMLEANKRDALESMQYIATRLAIDEAYADAMDHISDQHTVFDTHSGESEDLDQDAFSYQLKVLARDMNEANYPIRFGDLNELNAMGTELLRMMSADDQVRVLLEECDDDTKKWKTFRDSDPSLFRSYITGMGSVPLKGKWLEIDDEGNHEVTVDVEGISSVVWRAKPISPRKSRIGEFSIRISN
jgi:hypothetical protein